MIKSGLVLAGVFGVVGGCWGVGYGLGAYERPAPFTTCELDEKNKKITITLPFNRNNIKTIPVEKVSENVYVGYSNDNANMKITYERGEDDVSCTGKEADRWLALSYKYTVI